MTNHTNPNDLSAIADRIAEKIRKNMGKLQQEYIGSPIGITPIPDDLADIIQSELVPLVEWKHDESGMAGDIVIDRHELEELEEDNARLREALKKIDDWCPSPDLEIRDIIGEALSK